MGKYSMVELAIIAEKDCDGCCDQCVLGKPVVESPSDHQPMPEEITICTLFDYIRLNKPERKPDD